MGFLAPWFLAGLSALSIPVFVHLLRRHVTIPRPVSSLMFFERGTQSSTRHRRLRYLLLFALRFALLLLIVLAFADPFIRRSAADANGRLLLIVLDNSFSMRAGNRFADAKQQALATLSAKPHAQRAQIMALGGRLDILTQPTPDNAQLRTALQSIEPGDSHATFGDLGRGVRTLSESVHTSIDLHLFSDMQRTAMPAAFSDMVLPAEVTLILHPVARAATTSPNWTVESVEAPSELADPKDPRRSRVRAVIAGYNTPAADRKVALIVNDKTIATRTVKVPANGRTTVEFAPLDIAYGFSRCEIRILPDPNNDPDAFAADNASVFAILRSDPERVLFVHPAGETRPALYFGAALAAATQSSFLLQSVAAEQTADLDPTRFAFIVLADSQQLPSIFEHALEQYVARGGNVLITLGVGASAHARIPLWPTPIQSMRDYARLNQLATVGAVDFTYPALTQEKPGPDNNGWSDVKFLYAAAVDPGPTPASARIAMKLADGTPLLLDRPLGEGHVLLFTSAFDNLTSDLPLHPIFVAFVDRLARYLSGSERLAGSRLVDSFVELRAATAPVGEVASVEVLDPFGRRPLSLAEARSAQTFRLDHAGFYQIRFGNGRDAVIGVNPDRRESNLEAIPSDVQQLWAGNGSGGPEPQPAAALAPPQIIYRPVTLWWYVILLALLVALAESALASRYLGTQREDP